MQSATGAEVRAATGLVGSHLLGGTWQLDHDAGKGAVAAPLSAHGMASYAGVLAAKKATLTAITTDGGTAGDFITNDSTLIFSGTDSGITTNTLGIWISGGSYGTGNGGKGTLVGTVALASGQTSWSFDFTGTTLADGPYIVSLTNGSAPAASALSSRTITVDASPPTISSITDFGPGITSGNGNLNAGKVVTFTVAFSEAVTVTRGTPTLALSNGGVATYTSGSGSNSLTFSYTIAAGQNSADLTLAPSSAFHLNGATIRDVAGNNAVLTAANNYNPTGTLVIDTTPPTVSSVVASGAGITSGDGALNAGKVVTLTVNFSEAVTVSWNGGNNNAPTLALNDGGTATFSGASGTTGTALTFSYTVAAGQNTSDLTLAASNAFKLNGATIRDASGNNAVPSAANGYNPSGTLVIDTSPPAAPTAPDLTAASDSGLLEYRQYHQYYDADIHRHGGSRQHSDHLKRWRGGGIGRRHRRQLYDHDLGVVQRCAQYHRAGSRRRGQHQRNFRRPVGDDRHGCARRADHQPGGR